MMPGCRSHFCPPELPGCDAPGISGHYHRASRLVSALRAPIHDWIGALIRRRQAFGNVGDILSAAAKSRFFCPPVRL